MIWRKIGNIQLRRITNEEISNLIKKINYKGVTLETIKKLLQLICIEKEKGCWLINEDWSEYAAFEGVRAHRLSFNIFKGGILVGNEVCHTCDRKGCINPEHLFQGTHSDNMKDAIKKGRLVQINLNKKDKEIFYNEIGWV